MPRGEQQSVAAGPADELDRGGELGAGPVVTDPTGRLSAGCYVDQ